ncbi:MAG: arsenate reductase (glutaredoxin) [Alphaproteobacteria bacterium]
MTVVIWHNPRCSKSRMTLQLIENKEISPKVRLYLKDAPNAAEIAGVMQLLGLDDPRDLMRKGESDYKEQGLKDVTDPQALIDAMAATPKLIERPVVIVDGKHARIGRPPEQVLEIL